MFKRKKTLIVAILAFMCIVFLFMLTRKTTHPFTISKETTYLTEPVKPNGAIDYVSALNEKCGKDVTPENNAAVPLFQAYGPKNIDKNIRAKFFRMLAIAPLEEEGDYLVSIDDYLEKHNAEKSRLGNADNKETLEKRKDEFYKLAESPWSEEEHPLAIAWLQSNRNSLKNIHEASRRPKFFVPLVSEGEYSSMIDAFEPVCELREAGRLLIIHAMLLIRQRKFKEAQEDILACHRLARLAGENPTLTTALASIGLDRMASAGDVALAQAGGFNAQEAADYRQELLNLPPLPKMVDKIEAAERFRYLDSVSIIAKGGTGGEADSSANCLKNGPLKSLLAAADRSAFDWNAVFTPGNSWYDRFVEALRKTTRGEREAELSKIDRDLSQWIMQWKSQTFLWKSLLSGSSLQKTKSQAIGGIMICLILPAVQSAYHVEERAYVYCDLSQIALALGAYRSDQENYPNRLADLAPKYLAEIPKDGFSAGDFVYRREGNGYLLYSVGRNGKDDGGKSQQSDPPDEEGDDIAVRTPKEAE